MFDRFQAQFSAAGDTLANDPGKREEQKQRATGGRKKKERATRGNILEQCFSNYFFFTNVQMYSPASQPFTSRKHFGDQKNRRKMYV